MKIKGILLAAGHGTRFGGDKLLHPLSNGETLGLVSARKLIQVFEHSIAVVRESDVLLAEKLAQLGLQIITQNELDAGMGDNIALAVQASQEADAWVIALADMPWIQIDTLYLVRHTIENSALIAAPIFNGKRGHPVGFNHFFREQLLTLNGDNGAKSLLKNHVAQLQLLSVNDAGILRDVDRREDCLLSSSETVKKLKKQ